MRKIIFILLLSLLCQAAGDFRLADPRGTNHQDIFRHDFLAQSGGQLTADICIYTNHNIITEKL